MARTDEKDKKAAAAAKAKRDEKPAPAPLTPTDVLHRALSITAEYHESRDAVLLSRVLRFTGHLRKHLPPATLRAIIGTYVDASRRQGVLAMLDSALASPDVEMTEVVTAPATLSPVASSSSSASAAAAAPSASAPAIKIKLPRAGGPAALELEAYLTILVLSKLAAARAWAPLAEGSSAFIAFISACNKRTVDVFLARAYHYFCLASESLAGGVHGVDASIRPQLLAAHRTSCLRTDEYGEAVYINLLLRSFLAARDFSQAAALLSKVRFPEAASTAQLVRFSFYTGRVKAVQLEYSDAYESFQAAARKVPPTARALSIAITAFLSVVQLLMGDLPDRRSLSPPALAPYLAIVRAVRSGELARFRALVEVTAPLFDRHGTLTLIRRLEANVIKAGLRRIAAAYSCISFADVAARLHVGSVEDAEFLAAKAVRDGVLEATLDHTAGTLNSRATVNVYMTKEPQEAFHRRISFCLDVHNEAVRAMRYPPRVARTDLESAEAKKFREDEEALEAELDGMDDDDFMDE